jgi:uncharacterized protein YjgD (DUF1641 family)
MSTKSKDSAKNSKDQPIVEDKLEILLDQIVENSDTLLSFMPVLAKLKEAGITDLITNISKDYMPTDIEFFGHMFSSREFTYAGMKTANVMLSLMYAMADEKVSDTVKNLMFNSRGILESASSAAKDNSRLGTLELYHMMKDPEVASGIRAVLSLMKTIGSILKKTEE